MPNLSSHLFSLQKKKKKRKKESSQTSSKLLHVHSLLKFDGSYFKITFISNFEFKKNKYNYVIVCFVPMACLASPQLKVRCAKCIHFSFFDKKMICSCLAFNSTNEALNMWDLPKFTIKPSPSVSITVKISLLIVEDMVSTQFSFQVVVCCHQTSRVKKQAH